MTHRRRVVDLLRTARSLQRSKSTLHTLQRRTQAIPDDGLHASVTVNEWYKQEGEHVEEQEALCEIETPDFTYNFQSDVTGYLARILVRQGSVEAGQSIDTEDEIQPVREMTASNAVAEAGVGEKREREPEQLLDGGGEDEDVDDEVLEWLKGIEGDMEQYAPILREQGFDSLAAIKTLNKTDMKVLKIKKGHIRVLKQEIVKLKEEGRDADE